MKAMKLRIPAILASTSFIAAIALSAHADEPLSSKMGANAAIDAKTGKLTLVLKGKEAGVYVNTEYPTKCTLTGADGGTVEKPELTKADAKFEDAGKPGKAKSATFTVGATKKVTGSCKMVACSDSGCSAPFSINFATP